MADMDATLPRQDSRFGLLSNFRKSSIITASRSGGLLIFRKIGNLYTHLRDHIKGPSQPRVMRVPQAKVEFRKGASATENIETLLNLLAQAVIEKPMNSQLWFFENLAELPLPLKDISIPNPVKVQLARWYEGTATMTSVLLLHARPEPVTPDDVAVVVCKQTIKTSSQEPLAEVYRYRKGHMPFSEIIGAGGWEKFIKLIAMPANLEPPRPTAMEIMATRPPVPQVALPPREAAVPGPTPP